MVIFGGILEVTKEINDMYAFDFKTLKWKILFKEQQLVMEGKRSLTMPHKMSGILIETNINDSGSKMPSTR
jgi:hypothetical protein